MYTKSFNESMLIGKSNSLNKYVGFIDTVVEEVIARTKTKANPDGDDPYTTSMKIWTTLDPERQDVINNLYDGSLTEINIPAICLGNNKNTKLNIIPTIKFIVKTFLIVSFTLNSLPAP